MLPLVNGLVSRAPGSPASRGRQGVEFPGDALAIFVVGLGDPLDIIHVPIDAARGHPQGFRTSLCMKSSKDFPVTLLPRTADN